MNDKIKIFSLITAGILFSYTHYLHLTILTIFFEIFLYAILVGIGLLHIYNGTLDDIKNTIKQKN
jgi:hypothetical protein